MFYVPDWYIAATATLVPLQEARDRAREQQEEQPTVETKRALRATDRAVKTAVKLAKEEWMSRTSAKADMVGRGTKAAWDAVKDLKRAKGGTAPRRTALIKSKEGRPCTTHAQTVQRWKEHFQTVLNVDYGHDPGVLDNLLLHYAPPPLPDELIARLGVAPTRDEVDKALSRLQAGKASGKDGVVAEMLKAMDDELRDELTAMFGRVWEDGSVGESWRDMIVVALPKKGDLSKCDNWRGIALVELFGKLFAKVLQLRLIHVCEVVLGDTQCGFRPGRSCSDMAFVMSMFVGKAVEHRTPVHCGFVDLTKAYDSIPRRLAYRALRASGLPDAFVKVFQSFHEDMDAEVRLGDGTTTATFLVTSGLRQGCCMSPQVFNLVFHYVMEDYRRRAVAAGISVTFLWCEDRRIVGRLPARNRAQVEEMLTAEFADDAVTFAPDREHLAAGLQMFQQVMREWGLKLSVGYGDEGKTEAVRFGGSGPLPTPINLEGGDVVYKDSFRYLGTLLHDSGRAVHEVQSRIQKAAVAFGALRVAVFANDRISLRSKASVYRAIVLGVLLYGTELWPATAADMRALECFHNRCIRTLTKVNRQRQRELRLTSETLRARCGLPELRGEIEQRRLKWLGHVYRMPPTRLPRKLLLGWLDAPRPQGRPPMRWTDSVATALRARKCGPDQWKAIAVDRVRWRKFVEGDPEAAPTPPKRPRRAAVVKAHAALRRYFEED